MVTRNANPNGASQACGRAERRRKPAAALALLLLAALLSGCLYPKDRLAENRIPPREAVRNVQAAVDQFREEQGGLLPIRNSAADTPAYEKFPVDFAKLQRMNYIGDIPSAAFEQGGSYYFLILHEETEPVVKLMDLKVFQQLADIQEWADAYRRSNGGELPAGEVIYPGFRVLDFAKLGRKEPVVRSMYSGQPMTLMLDESGKVYADYGADIRKALEKVGAAALPANADLREALVAASDFVPVKSPAYRSVNGDPQAVPPDKE